jgi:hypothetical protein
MHLEHLLNASGALPANIRSTIQLGLPECAVVSMSLYHDWVLCDTRFWSWFAAGFNTVKLPFSFQALKVRRID